MEDLEFKGSLAHGIGIWVVGLAGAEAVVG